jgi:8-oxo-dGTP pyrophosphatase MutT (NUDIX family)
VSDLTALISAIKPVDEQEASSIAATLALLARPGLHFDEDVDPVHVTGSAFIISERGVVLHKHKKLGIWVQPGGHIETGETPAQAALREGGEETGLSVAHLESGPLLVHVDVHPGPRGHTHHDLRYLILSEPVDPTPPPEESQDVAWFDFEHARQRCDPSLVGVLSRVEEIWQGLGLSGHRNDSTKEHDA